MTRIVSVVPNETLGRKRESLFAALRNEGALVEVADAESPEWLDWVAKATSFSPRGMQRWRERYEYSPVTRAAMTVSGARRARRIEPHPDALLQIGAYYDFTRSRGLSPGLRCSYHDANLAVYSREFSWIKDLGARHIKRAMAAEQRVFDGLELIFVMSQWLRRSFIEDFGQDPDKVVVVGGGANMPRVPEPTERDWEQPRLLFIAVEWRRKGGPDLLRAFETLRSKHPRAELRIVGLDPPTGDGARPGVQWLGRIDRGTPEGNAEIERLHREATAYVMPSIFDPFANVFLEAMAWGLPCVGTDRCSMPEVIENDVTGLIAPARDPVALADVLLRLASDPERSRQMGEEGRQRFLRRYTWKRVAERMLGEIRKRIGTIAAAATFVVA
jgi:glycosyltransferase involved in cell wall biosynthesis